MSNVLRGAVTNPEKVYGKSAYEIAVMHGFEGTEEEWIAHLESAQSESVKEASEKAHNDIEEAKRAMLSDIELAAEIVQTTGNSETAVMSQKAVTDELTALDERSNSYTSFDVTERGEELTAVTLKETPLKGFSICGKTTQETTPTIDNPVPLVNSCEGGSATITFAGEKASQTLVVDTKNGLRGVLAPSGTYWNYIDEDGRAWICDEIDFKIGAYRRWIEVRANKVYNSWELVGSVEDNTWRFGLVMGMLTTQYAIACSHFPRVTTIAEGHAKGGGIIIHDNGYIEIISPRHKTLEEFIAWNAANPISFVFALRVYELDWVTADEEENYNAIRLRKGETTITNDVNAGMKLTYERFSKVEKEIVQTTGDNEMAIMSQKAVTDELNNLDKKIGNYREITLTETGEEITASNLKEVPLQGLTMYGRTAQATTPTINAPVPLVSACKGGSASVSFADDNNTQTLSVATPNGLWGIPVSSGGNYTDKNGQQWICDEIDFARGVYIQRVAARTNMDYSAKWGMSGTVDANNWRFGLPMGMNAIPKSIRCSHFQPMSSIADGHAKGGGIDIYANGYIEIVSPTHKTLAEFKAWQAANPIDIMFALETPVETALTSGVLARFRAIRLCNGVTTVTNDTGAWMALTYERKVLLERQPMLTFIDDDASPEAFGNWEKIGDAAGITNTFAVVTNRQTTNPAQGTRWDIIERMLNKGYEFISHTHTHKDIVDTDEETIIEEFNATISALKEHGCNPKYLVYPNNKITTAKKALVKNYFSAGIYGGDEVNVPPISPYAIKRHTIVTSEKIDKVLWGETRSVWKPKTFEQLKAIIDESVVKGGWVIFMTHLFTNSYGYYCDEELRQLLVDVCKYAASVGVKIATFGEAFEAFKNRVATGEPTDSSYYIVDCDGKEHIKG